MGEKGETGYWVGRIRRKGRIGGIYIMRGKGKKRGEERGNYLYKPSQTFPKLLYLPKPL